jgi:hypothetical protein
MGIWLRGGDWRHRVATLSPNAESQGCIFQNDCLNPKTDDQSATNAYSAGTDRRWPGISDLLHVEIIQIDLQALRGILLLAAASRNIACGVESMGSHPIHRMTYLYVGCSAQLGHKSQREGPAVSRSRSSRGSCFCTLVLGSSRYKKNVIIRWC